MMQSDPDRTFSSAIVDDCEGSTSKVRDAATVYIADDDHFVRRAWQRQFEQRGIRVRSFADPIRFLEQLPEDPQGCALLDVNMPGMSGLELQRELTRRGCHLPIIFITANTDVAVVVEAMKGGAFHFFLKPVEPDILYDVVRRALAHERITRARRLERQAILTRVALLTPREMDVARLVASGLLNKQIAHELGITEKTVKVHRARAMAKLNVDSVANLVRIIDYIRTNETSPMSDPI